MRPWATSSPHHLMGPLGLSPGTAQEPRLASPTAVSFLSPVEGWGPAFHRRIPGDRLGGSDPGLPERCWENETWFSNINGDELSQRRNIAPPQRPLSKTIRWTGDPLRDPLGRHGLQTAGPHEGSGRATVSQGAEVFHSRNTSPEL